MTSRVHTVGEGERVSEIAAHYRVPVAAVLDANPQKARARTLGGAEVFAALSVGEDIALPAMLGAGPGEPCDLTTWCDSGYHCSGRYSVCLTNDPKPPPGGSRKHCGSSEGNCGQNEYCWYGTDFFHTPTCVATQPDGAPCGIMAGSGLQEAYWDSECQSGQCIAGYCGGAQPLVSTVIPTTTPDTPGTTSTSNPGDACAAHATVGADLQCYCDAGYDRASPDSECVKTSQPAKPPPDATPPETLENAKPPNVALIAGVGVALLAVAIGGGIYIAKNQRKTARA
jgi:hypothetical protein